MVGEYNRMLDNLEDSKKALARSEKESAWREIAQQVAHEIKNPLTPMKLTLQHLNRKLVAKGRGRKHEPPYQHAATASTKPLMTSPLLSAHLPRCPSRNMSVMSSHRC